MEIKICIQKHILISLWFECDMHRWPSLYKFKINLDSLKNQMECNEIKVMDQKEILKQWGCRLW